MKKQLLKYYIMLFILMICPVTVFTACSEDDDPTEQNNGMEMVITHRQKPMLLSVHGKGK